MPTSNEPAEAEPETPAETTESVEESAEETPIEEDDVAPMPESSAEM